MRPPIRPAAALLTLAALVGPPAVLTALAGTPTNGALPAAAPAAQAPVAPQTPPAPASQGGHDEPAAPEAVATAAEAERAAGETAGGAPPATRDAAYRSGLEAVAAGRDAEALALFEVALEAAPDDLPAADQYRKAVIRTGDYDRAIAFFDRLTADHPDAANAWLNYGYAYVDKIPAAGSITQVILASEALSRFSRSIELRPSWVALYTRGNSYLYWPKIFGRAPLGVSDLEEAVTLAEAAPELKRVYVRAWRALGDGYWKTDQPERARATWRQGLERFPGDPGLEARLAGDDAAVEEYLYEHLDPSLRVDTDLTPLWAEE